MLLRLPYPFDTGVEAEAGAEAEEAEPEGATQSIKSLEIPIMIVVE